MKEYIIWGKPKEAQPNDILAETVIMDEKAKIQNMTHAKNIIKILNQKYGFHSMRIQVIDGSPINWSNTIK